MLNEEIKKFKQGDECAFNNIIKIMSNDINKIVYKYNIPGKDKQDLISIAMEEILDCIKARKLRRGQGTKKVINENDSELKNYNFIKAAINYRFIRELRATKSNIRVSYDIPFLQDNGENYKDRKGKPLYIGVIFRDDKAFLIENMKNTKLVLNINKNHINKNLSTYDMKNPIDGSISFDLVVSDKDSDHEIKDVLEYNTARNEFKHYQNAIEMNVLSFQVNNSILDNNSKRIIQSLLNKSNNTLELKDYYVNNKKSINKLKWYLRTIL